ncbi:MAG TPA: VOC family protein [Candidatus Dormibacteraeota bacterium]|nr:VOC family protein [Candidatus Dormibacteraeota bacterium]
MQARAAAALPAQDLERAKAWYSEKLGLTPAGFDMTGGALYQLSAGTGFLVFQSSGKPSGTHTQMALEVQDFDSTIRDLKAHGVKLEEYDLPGLKTVDGVAEMGDVKLAWFKDSEGNVIGIGTPVPVTAAR